MSGLRHRLFFRVCLMSLSIMPSGSTHAAACGGAAFLSGWTTLVVWMDHVLLVHSFLKDTWDIYTHLSGLGVFVE